MSAVIYPEQATIKLRAGWREHIVTRRRVLVIAAAALVAAVLAGVALTAQPGLEPGPPPTCCPCAAEAAYVVDLDAAFDAIPYSPEEIGDAKREAMEARYWAAVRLGECLREHAP